MRFETAPTNLRETIDLSGFGIFIADVEEGLQLVVVKTAYDGVAESQSLVPVDTGATKNSHFIVTEDGAPDKENALALAEAARPGVKLFDEEDKVENLQALIVVATNYAQIVENRKPYLTPAVLNQEKNFIAACSSVVAKARGIN